MHGVNSANPNLQQIPVGHEEQLAKMAALEQAQKCIERCESLFERGRKLEKSVRVLNSSKTYLKATVVVVLVASASFLGWCVKKQLNL
jgi:predicted nucleic acid-binding Zn ribbon protein